MKSLYQLNEDLTRSSFKGYGQLQDPTFAYVLRDKYDEDPNPLDFYNYVRKVFMEIRNLMIEAWKSIPEPIAVVPTIAQFAPELGTPTMLDKTIGKLAKQVQQNDSNALNVQVYKTGNYIQSVNETVHELLSTLDRFSKDWPEIQESVQLLKKLQEYIKISGIVRFIKGVEF
jgi:hypothetical protein